MFRNEKIGRPKNPIKDSMFISRLFFIWMKDIFRTGMKRTLDDQDMYESLNEHKSNNLDKYFTKLWNTELDSKKNPSLLRILFKAYGVQLVLASVLYSSFYTFLSLLQPICLGGLVSYFASNQIEISKEMAYLYAGGISISTVCTAIMFHPFIFYIYQTYLKYRNGLSSLIYKKILRLSKSTVFDGMDGKVINMLSNDIGKLEYAIAFLYHLWKGPSEVIIIGYYLYKEIGKSAIIALLFLLSFIPLQIWMAKKAASFNLRAAKQTDIRVKFMNEIIQGMQVIKMYAWEKSFAKMVDKVRRKELKVIRGLYFIEGILNSFLTVSRLSIFLSLMTYVYFGEDITASKVFITTSCLLILNSSMIYCWPVALTEGAGAWVSIKRIEKFLLSPEEKKFNKMQTLQQNGNSVKSNIKYDPDNNKSLLGKGIYLKDVSASWTSNENSAGIFSVNLEVKQNNLCTIIGLVGSGKTTLLNVIIGELDIDEGRLNVNGSLSYASQETWLFDGTIKQNILFVEEYDEARYRDVCRVCALERDFQLLPFKDLTLVGERGVILSGGQKARVSLARAVYRQADIYLLDDPLSAVDAHVGKQIFTECILNYLKGKCVILVTHQIQYLKNVEHIVLIDNGKVEVQGNVADLRKIRGNILSALEVPDVAAEDNINKKKRLESQTSITLNEEDGEIEEEQKEVKENLVEGRVSFKVYKKYAKSIKSGFSVLVVGILFVVSQLSLIAVDYFLAQWANWEELQISSNFTAHTNTTTNMTEFKNSKTSETRTNYIIVYTVLTVVFVFLLILQNILYFKMSLRASINLHNNLFMYISRATMSFFNTNPSGRILNRFSKDIGAIDSRLPLTMMNTITCFMGMISIGILVSAVNPWLLLPTGILTILLYVLRNLYLRTSRSINRIQSINRSPVFAHANATMQGLSTIRAFKAQHALNDEFNKHLNNLTGATFMYYATSRAFALWLDTMCAMYLVIVTMSCLLFSDNALGGDVGLIITKSIVLIGMSQWGIRQSAELENNMVSVERINEYSKLKQEPPLETPSSTHIPIGWPESGAITFRSFNLKYSDDGPFVLKNLNFAIKPKEKIGVVGRTGAGKSSLIQAIFRLTENDGEIEIDGINIKSVGLHDLRTNISIIPQDPVLFSGTMRSNLDPFLEKSDTDLWYALEQVQLKRVVSSLAGGLDSKISDSGSNFSMGQRQLVCLARAILKNNRILILDEATANVDSETDQLIQATIRNTFAECTVITIAHRLHTVLDSDRILVMDAGQVAEFDSPSELLKHENGYFTRLAKQSGSLKPYYSENFTRDDG